MSTGAIDWKNAGDVEQWRATRRKTIEQVWGTQFKPLLFGIPLAADPHRGDSAGVSFAAIRLQHELDRDEEMKAPNRPAAKGTGAWSVPDLIARVCAECGFYWKDGKPTCEHQAGELELAPHARRAHRDKITKAKAMFNLGLEHKAHRELACGLLGAEVRCSNGHKFRESYECGNRYCVTCGPAGATELFAKMLGRIRLAAARLLDCGQPNCRYCEWWRANPGKTRESNGDARALPHWPPPPGNKRRPRVVVAALDFTLVNTGETPEPIELRQLNLWIKKFFRTIERSMGLGRDQYGSVFCDELGGNNTNMHAHSIYVGPWLPQGKQKLLSQLWERVTGGRGRIVSIKYAESIEKALYHAIKYPAKFAQIAKPDRLAELEVIFHRVRRVHRLASFYNCPEPDDDNRAAGTDRQCPACGEPLSDPKWWCMIEDLIGRGLRDVIELNREIGKNKVLLGWGNSSP